MRGLRIVLICLLTLLPAKAAFALHCYFGHSGGEVEKSEAIEPFAIPSNAQVGDKIWESNDIKIPVYCDNNATSDMAPENVYAWLNPYISANDPYYELGVSYNGIDYDAGTAGGNGIDTHHCLDNKKLEVYPDATIEQMGWPVCTTPAERKYSTTFMARMRLYVKIREMPPHDYVSSLSDYIIVQFDGKGGVNASPDAANLKYHITGLNNIRVLDCYVTFSVQPETQNIDFGKFNALDISRQSMTKAFSIMTTKDQNNECTDGFKLSSSFYSDSELRNNDTELLIGNGLKLRILDSTTPYTFNQYEEFADFTSDMRQINKVFQAELSAVEGEKIKTGPFDTVVVFKINYH